ncbi:site-specific DNA-methyltransferase [Aerococcus urinae]
MTKHVPSGSPDLTQMNINKLKELFPEAITDGGKIDFETLQTILGEEIDDEGERYSFTWPGKRESILGSQLPSKGTLRPNIDKSKDFDHTENLYIEGDNLEVLKLLQKSYNSKVKVIYIDPPYNTGNDFIYKDNFREGVKNYLEQTGQVDSNGNLLSTNSESNGRFHTNWLNMMYPRLRLARNLLTMDGVILISISDKEAANLKHICDEIFGEKNFIENFVWVISGNTDNQDPIIRNHEYILCYAKNAKKVAINNVIDPNIPENSKVRRNFVQNSIIKNGSKNPPSLIKLPKGFPARIESKVFKKTDNLEQVIKEINRVGYISRSITKKFKLHYPLHSENLIIENFKLQNDIDVYSGWANNKKLEEFIDNSCKPILNEDGSEIEFYLTSTGTIEYMKKGRESQHILTVLHNMGTTEKEKYELENMGLSFDFPKPKKLIEYLLSIFSNSSDIILDFFLVQQPQVKP